MHDYDFSKMSLQSLSALRDVASDSLRETEESAADIRKMLSEIKWEIESRGTSK